MDNTVKDFNEYLYENSLTPYIIEERKMNITQMDIFSRLMKERIIWVNGPINDNVSTIVQAQLLFLENVDAEKDVYIYLDTPGGSVKSGLSMIDTMDKVPYDITTINTGMCASMGSVLLGAGTKGKRVSLRFSKVMTHQVSSGMQGNVQDTRISHYESEKYNFMLFKLLGKYSGKSWKTVLEASERDNWMDAYQTKKFGLIDEVIEPKDYTLGDVLDGFDEYKKYIERK
jgi:ATP-dependent Clp protease protease subunit